MYEINFNMYIGNLNKLFEKTKSKIKMRKFILNGC